MSQISSHQKQTNRKEQMKTTLTIIAIAFLAWLWQFWTPVHPKGIVQDQRSQQWQPVAERVVARVGHQTTTSARTPL